MNGLTDGRGDEASTLAHQEGDDEFQNRGRSHPSIPISQRLNLDVLGLKSIVLVGESGQ